MPLHRLTSITVGVPDRNRSSEFMRDFGLTDSGDGTFATRDGGDQLTLVEAPQRGLQRLGVGASTPDDLARIESRAASVGLGTVVEASEERVVVREPATGLLVDITVAEPYDEPKSPAPPNAPGNVDRFDRPADSVLADMPATPSNLTHVVYGTTDYSATLRFFVDVIGFEVSDTMHDIIAFTRCSDLHHNLAIQAAPVPLLHHVAFEMDTIDDVVARGQHMVDMDPERHMWGVGRHAIGSNWFWYLREPGGTFFEYAADIDRISTQDAYNPKDWNDQEMLYSFGPAVPDEFLAPRDLDELIAASAAH